MKRFFLLIMVCALALPGMVYAAETETRTWTDENGVKHITTITREAPKRMESGDDAASHQEWQEQKAAEQTAAKKPEAAKKVEQKTESAIPAGVKTDGSFQFDIDSHKPKF